MFINVRQRPNTVGLLVGADTRTSVPTVRGWIIACVTYYSLVLACEAGTRRGHYNGWVVRTVMRTAVVVRIRDASQPLRG